MLEVGVKAISDQTPNNPLKSTFSYLKRTKCRILTKNFPEVLPQDPCGWRESPLSYLPPSQPMLSPNIFDARSPLNVRHFAAADIWSLPDFSHECLTARYITSWFNADLSAIRQLTRVSNAILSASWVVRAFVANCRRGCSRAHSWRYSKFAVMTSCSIASTCRQFWLRYSLWSL